MTNKREDRQIKREDHQIKREDRQIKREDHQIKRLITQNIILHQDYQLNRGGQMVGTFYFLV